TVANTMQNPRAYDPAMKADDLDRSSHRATPGPEHPRRVDDVDKRPRMRAAFRRGAMRASLVVSLILAAASTEAAAGTDRIVLEVRNGSSATDATALLEPIYAALGERGFVYGAALSREIDARISRDGGELSASDVIEAQRKGQQAYENFINGD